MKEYTNNGVLVTKPTGCWNCKHLDYFEKDSYESLGPEGWMCNWNENAENFKDFPCKRKLKCFVESNYTEEDVFKCPPPNKEKKESMII